MPENATEDWLKEKDVDYVIISIHKEFKRDPVDKYYYPKIDNYKVKLIKQKYSTIRPPPDLEFGSDLYKRFEEKHEKIKEIYREGQKVFVIRYL